LDFWPAKIDFNSVQKQNATRDPVEVKGGRGTKPVNRPQLGALFSVFISF
jgi:hypothetical protein